jgi:hypothetical protein
MLHAWITEESELDPRQGKSFAPKQWRTEGGGQHPPPPEIPKFWQSWVEFPVPWKIHP